MLGRLKRERAIRLEELRRGIAIHFSVLGTDFNVKVNGKAITPSERLLYRKCQFSWRSKNMPIAEGSDLVVNGWVGTMRDTIPEGAERGIILMTRGKLVQEASTFDIGGKGLTGQVALAYLVGEIHADFLDDTEDLISTGRRSVVWEREPAATLRTWLNGLIRYVCGEWVKKREAESLKAVQTFPSYKGRIAKLPAPERKFVDKFLATVVKAGTADADTLERITDFAASNVEYQSFLAFVEALEKADTTNPEEIIKFFQQWEVLDTADMIRLIEGRVEAINKFQELVQTRAREIPTLHTFLADNPWLLDPSWDYLDDEVTYSDLLRNHFPDEDESPEENRRIDFLCLGYGQTLNVVELKRPGSKCGRKELRQLEDYVDFVKSKLGTDPMSYSAVYGYLIAGEMSRDEQVVRMANRIAEHGMYVRTFANLRTTANRVHARFIEILERKSVRMEDTRIDEGIVRLKTKVKGEAETTETAHS